MQSSLLRNRREEGRGAKNAGRIVDPPGHVTSQPDDCAYSSMISNTQPEFILL